MTQGLHPLVRDILIRRGYKKPEDVAAFLNPDYDTQLHDPFLMKGMQAAVDRILKAVEKKESIVIYGDYDIDGITASTVMVETIKNLGHEARSYIPDRFEEGYGINHDALEKLKAQGTDLVITVDCGITSAKEVAWAMENGLDIIVTDHHSVPEVVPEAVAVINPKQSDCEYPFKDLAGVGVAFKLAQALQQASGKPQKGHEKWLLDVVALGTVCDVVTLVGENRVLASFGLKVMNKTRRVGIRALAEVSGVEMGSISSYTLGFMFGPRMNAAGRLEHAARSLELMLTNDATRAREIAGELDSLNKQRQSDQAKIVKEAKEMALEYADDPVLVLASPDWSHGIVGIAASKVAESAGKPTLIMQIMGDQAKGSARSFGGFNLIDALRTADDLFVKYGGHAFAAGYTIPVDKLDELRDRLNEHFLEVFADLPEQAIDSDVNLDDFNQIDWDLHNSLVQLEPFGNGNRQPSIAVQSVEITGMRWVGSDKRHAKLTLSDGKNRLSGIGFGLADKYPDLVEGQQVGIVAHVDKNDFNGNSTLQLVVRDVSEVVE